MINNRDFNFLKVNIQQVGNMKRDLRLFLKEWRCFYPDQLKTHIENIVYTVKISKMEAMKMLEEKITNQFNYLIKYFQSFPDPFKIYSFWDLTNVNNFLNNCKEELFALSQGGFPEFWAWSRDSSFPPYEEVCDEDYEITGLVFKKDVNWALTLLKNCELTIGLNEKEVILFPNIKIKIVKIEGNNFLKEFRR